MGISKWLILAGLACAIGGGSACSPSAENQANSAYTTDKAADDTKNVAQKIEGKAKEIAGKTGDKTKEITGAVVDKSKDVVSGTGEAITDGWITTKVSAKFVDETLLKGSNINVDTNDHVVTLKGPVGSDAAKARAVAIARGTEGVARVVDQLVVKVR